MPTCPNCGGDLAAIDPTPATPPYACFTCCRGWWNAELTEAARESWDPTTRTFGDGPAGQTVALEAHLEAWGGD